MPINNLSNLFSSLDKMVLNFRIELGILYTCIQVLNLADYPFTDIYCLQHTCWSRLYRCLDDDHLAIIATSQKESSDTGYVNGVCYPGLHRQSLAGATAAPPTGSGSRWTRGSSSLGLDSTALTLDPPNMKFIYRYVFKVKSFVCSFRIFEIGKTIELVTIYCYLTLLP